MCEQVLRGLDGSNPLAFLAALGVLRVITCFADESLQPRMGWRVELGAWRPYLYLSTEMSDEELAEAVADACRCGNLADRLPDGDDLTISGEQYRQYANAAVADFLESQRVSAEFAAALACEVPVGDGGTVEDTAFRTMSGAGHQHFLKTMRNFCSETQAAHIYKALYKAWKYDDPLRNMSMRWDPADDSRYALRWSNPSGDRERQYRGSMWGANRLAIEGLPLFPVMPTRRQLETVGFRTAGARGTFLTWPIWESPIELETLRSVLSIKELQADHPDREKLMSRGVAEVFRCQRLTVGKFRSFTSAMPV